MEKQLTFFEIEENDDFSIWFSIPEKIRQRIESIFANLLIKHLSSSLKEINEHDKQ